MLTLYNSVLSSLLLYFFSFYKVSKKVSNVLVKLQRCFLWGGDKEKKKVPYHGSVGILSVEVSVRVVCLGEKNLECLTSLLAKWH